MQFFVYLQVLLLDYIVPFVFAIGLIFFIYAIIKYFILGPGEEPTRDEGRIYFIKALVWFTGGLVLYGLVVAFSGFSIWIMDVGVTTDSENRIQNVPNVPEQR